MTSKERVKRSFSVRISTKIKTHSKANKTNNSKELQKCLSGSSLMEEKNKIQNSYLNSKETGNNAPVKHKRKSLLRRSISNHFKSFSSFRHKIKNKENGNDECKTNGVENQSQRSRSDAENDVNVGNIRLKVQFSRSFRRTLPRKYKSASEVNRNKIFQRQNLTARRREKSFSDFGGIQSQKLATLSDLKLFKTSLSMNLKSRLDSNIETIDFSDLVKSVTYRKNKQIDEPVSAGVDNILELTHSSKLEKINKINLRRNYASQTELISPTCGDIYGQDEEENKSFQFLPLAEAIGKEEVHKSDAMVGSVQQSEGKAIDQHSENDIGKTSSVYNDFDEELYKTAKNVEGVIKSGKYDMFKGKKAKRVSANNLDLETDPVFICNMNESFGNPWVLQTQTDSQGTTGKESYESFGFDVNTFDESREMRRNESRESIDSFSSSVHSVHTKDLLFSDSEAEFDADQISLSSTDSGTFENQQTPFSCSDKSLDSKINTLSKTKVNQSLDYSQDISVEFNMKKSQQSKSDKPKITQSVSLDESKSGLVKTPKPWSGFKSSSLDSGTSTKKDKLKQRRSLDSNLKIKEMSLDLSEPFGEMTKSKLTGSSDSGLSSVLSPVLEMGSHVSMRAGHSSSNLSNIDENTKFFTLPNPRKIKSYPSPKKRVTRIGSLSKKLSEKAQSLSNIKLGSSFKLRNSSESDKWKVPEFIKTNSLTNLMVKKGTEVASSLSTLIRGRSNSNIIANSPFKQKAKKKRKDENENELVYEKVRVIGPRKRPANSQEIAAWKKRLSINIKLAKSAQNNNMKGRSRFHSDSVLRHLPSSDSLSPIRSPTLLDEILKSVDGSTFKRLCKNVDTAEEDESDGGESSHSSSNVLYQSTTVSDSVNDRLTLDNPVYVCMACGRLRSSSELSEKVAISPLKRCCQSLGDLYSSCKCVSERKHCSYSGIVNQDFNAITHGRKGKILKGSLDRLETHCSAGYHDFDQVDDKITAPKLGTKRSFKPHSMFELRQIEKNVIHQGAEREPRRTGKISPRNSGAEESLNTSGSLLRHRPLMDLSADNLDEAVQNSGFSQEYIPGGQRSGIESETFHSCSDLLDTTLDDTMDETTGYNVKSHSCSDLLDDREIIVLDNLGADNSPQSKKAIRKVKVKSLSSSHDALSTLVPMEITSGEIAEHNLCTCRGGDCRVCITTCANECLSNVGSHTSDVKEKTGSEMHSDGNVNSGCSQVNENQSPNCDENSYVCDKENNHCSCFKNYKENDKGIAPICNKCNKLRLSTSKCKRSSMTYDKFAKISTKPPLPHKKSTRKVLSVSDVRFDDNKKNQNSERKKRYSMFDLTKDTPNISGVGIKHIVKNNTEIRSRLVEPNSNILSTKGNYPTTPKTDKSVTTVRRFLFDDHQIKAYTNSVTKLDRLKSISNDEIKTVEDRSSYYGKKAYSAHSLNRISRHSWSDDVFNRLSFPPGPPSAEKFSPLNGFMESPPFAECSSPGGYQEFTGPDVETAHKYDVCLGYLLHSIQCDNKLICVYSLQRNKQLMESVITPLAALPGVPHTRPSEHSNVNKKTPNKDLTNPATPITIVPSDQLAHAGRVLRTVLLSRFSHMIRDRKFHLRTYRRCMVGTEMVDWLLQQSSLVHSRNQAVGMWQALVEEGVVVHVCHEHQFKDKYLFYRFHDDEEGVPMVTTGASKRECEEELQDIFLILAHIGPDAMMRMILRKLPHERTAEDLEIIYEELLHIKALSHLSTMVKRELASVLVFESLAKSGTVLFNQGDEGKSWYILLKGSVNVVIYGKGVVCTLHEGDDFGKLALVNDAPRAATIVLRDDNCHFLRVDKDDFNRILRDVEANTVRLKEHGQDVLVLEKIPSDIQSSDGTVHAHYKYSVMAGTPEKMLEHLLESRLDSKGETEIDGFLEDFLLTHVIFMPCNHLCPVLISHYHSSMADTSEQEAFEFMLNHKKCVLHFVQEWANIVGAAFREDQTINAFMEELHSCVTEDLHAYTNLKDDMVSLESILQSHSESSDGKSKRRISGNFTLARKLSRELFQDLPNKRKPIKASDETIFKVYCADHTYSTLRLPRDTKVEVLLQNTKEKLGLGDDLVLCEVKSTGERLIFKDNDLCVTSGLSINGRLFVTPKEHLDALTPLPEQEGPSDGTFSQIETTSSREMAYYMTMYDWELFTCVQEYELIYQVFGRYKFGKITANLDLFLRRFNEIQYWVVTEMVLTSNLSKRVSLLRKFIKLASYCKEHQNLNSFFAIVMGLSNIAVSRLSQTWEKLPGKFKKMFADFETLMDPSRNHRVYRLSVAKMFPPIIPFMPLLMKDMTFTHEGNKTYFDGLVNFEKMHMIAQTLKTVRFCRSAHLVIEVPSSLKCSETATYIRNLTVIDNQRFLTQLSHKLEPRKT